MIETKKPKVTLVTATENPLLAIAVAVSAWHKKGSIIDDKLFDKDYQIECFGKVLKAPHKTALEYVKCVFVIENVSRAFQQQLTRTRLAGYSIQSLRVVDIPDFATNGNYTMPPNLNISQNGIFHKFMVDTEFNYQTLLNNGMLVEDARGILPLNVHSNITFAINLNSLYHMLSQRLCLDTQWEFRQVAMQIRNQIAIVLGGIFANPIDCPCKKTGKCLIPDNHCGHQMWNLPEKIKNKLWAMSKKEITNKQQIKEQLSLFEKE